MYTRPNMYGNTLMLGGARYSSYGRALLRSAHSFGDASDTDVMNQEVAALRTAWQQGLQTVASNSGGVVSDILNYVNGTSDTEDSIAANYTQIKTYIDQLDGPLRQQVISGQDASGNPYDISKWTSFASDVQSDITAQTGYSWDAAGLNVIKQTAAQTASDASNPFKWPWWAWVGIAGAGLYLTAPIFKFLTAKKTSQSAA